MNSSRHNWHFLLERIGGKLLYRCIEGLDGGVEGVDMAQWPLVVSVAHKCNASVIMFCIHPVMCEWVPFQSVWFLKACACLCMPQGLCRLLFWMGFLPQTLSAQKLIGTLKCHSLEATGCRWVGGWSNASVVWQVVGMTRPSFAADWQLNIVSLGCELVLATWFVEEPCTLQSSS